ncbi:GNAT family N-acetyltransferase [Stenotrophomonas geniculata]|uniref:GNAT family N-acetyltransferase n=1 Tax=Stenotrophomonas geniculata TaxID=86188 RepID=UPI0037502CDB
MGSHAETTWNGFEVRQIRASDLDVICAHRNVYVEPEYRRRGIARALMALAGEDFAERGATYAVLHATAQGSRCTPTLAGPEPARWRAACAAMIERPEVDYGRCGSVPCRPGCFPMTSGPSVPTLAERSIFGLAFDPIN